MSDLFSCKENIYGDKYKDHLFEQYKLYFESAEKISDRRRYANSFYISLLTAILTLIGIFFQIERMLYKELLQFVVPLIGILFCVVYWFQLNSYKQMNTGKFKVIHEIENKLPLALFKKEWEHLGEGNNKKLYFPFSHIEMYIPWLFGFVFFVLSVTASIKLYNCIL